MSDKTSEKPTAAWVETGRAVFTPNYRQFPVVLVRGEGAHVWDSDGRRYLDFVAGIAVNVLGHAHPMLVDAVTDQVRALVHCSNLYFNEPAIALGEAITKRTGFDARVFFANSGAEANEAAVKLARRYWRKVRGEDRFEIITMNASFHGRTLTMTTATGQPKYHEGFEPLTPGFVYANFGDLASIEAAIGGHTAAVMLEPIQGEGGIIVPPDGWLRALRELCDRKGVLLILDEVQTGVGRTGTFFAYEHDGVTPDIVTLAKGLGGGVPIGAMLARREVAEGFQPGLHATTFGGNPLACRAGQAVLEAMDAEGLLDNCRAMGEYLLGQLRSLAQDEKGASIVDVRGRGLMVGVAVRGVEPRAVMESCLRRGLLLNTAGTDVVRMVPPLIIGKGHVRTAVEILGDALAEVAAAR